MYKTLAAALALTGVAHAQERPDVLNAAPGGAESPQPPADGRVVYDPAFFTAYAPQTALDMVRRVPGFSVDSGSDRRGFSGTAGNVLIDGARPSAKSQGLEDILARIPAAQVAHIDLIRSASNSEAAGQSVLVDVVRTAAKGGSGTYAADLQRTDDKRVEVRGSGSYTGHVLGSEFTVGADRYIENRPLQGNRLLRDSTNSLTGARVDVTPRTYREANVNAALTTPLWGGTLHLNGSGGRWNFATTLESLGYSPVGTLTDSFGLSINEREREREIGGDYERKFGNWTFKAVGLDTMRWYANDERTQSRDASFNTIDTQAQLSRNLSTETIGRLSASWAINGRHRIEFGGETALNTLDTHLTLTENGAAIVLPSANVTVEEERQEGFATWTWKPAAKWTLESGVTVETSTISQTGDTSASRTLTYWKPSFQVSRQFGVRDQARVKIFRDVSQLDFGDFASSATLADNTVAAGNPDLRPQATWRLEGVIDKRFGENGALSLTVGKEWIEDVTDLVPIFDPMSGQFFDAPGNIGEGEHFTAVLKGTVPVGALIKGGQLEFNVSYIDTEVTDPTTLQLRPESGTADVYAEVSFRQDLPQQKLAWGVSAEGPSERRFFRVAERETFAEGPFVDAFVETTRFKGAKVRVVANNLLDNEFRRERRFFAPDRNGPFVREELRERQFGRFFGIEVSGNF